MKIYFKNIILISIMVNVSACSNLEWPPQNKIEFQKPMKFNTKTSFNRFSDIPPSGIIRVKKGDTLYTISRRYGVPSQTIVAANELTPPYRLMMGDSLILPKPSVHIVVRGDTLYKIARRYEINFYQLARLNRLETPFHLYPKQKLVLPIFRTTAPMVYSGMKKREVAVSATNKKKSPGKNNDQVENRISLKSPMPKYKKDKRVLSQLKSVAIPRVKTSGRFNWPVRGRLSSIYGAKGQGLHNDGINIIAPRGTAVRAAASGTVVYAGNELRGFGNLLLIKHAEGWVTAYAHNETLLVKRSEKVNKGQIIAKVGASGNVVQPQLHFEVRKGKRAIDPLRHLRRLTAKFINGIETSKERMDS